MAKQATAASPDMREAARDAQAGQAAREAKAAGPQPTAVGPVATGQKLIRTMGPGNLRPNARDESIRAGVSVYCGRMTGIAYGVRRHPNNKDATKESLCFAGKFLSVKHSGEVVQSLECYLPSVVERAFAGMLESRAAIEVRFALEVWAEPDSASGRKTAQGFAYVAHDMMPPTASDPLMDLAAAAGVIIPPSRQIAGPAPGGYDPETGEVSEELA